MSKAYTILKTTNSISRALDDGSVQRIHRGLIELQDDMREFQVEDESYSEVIEALEKLLEVTEDFSEIENISNSVEIPDDVITQIRVVTHRVDGLYLRNSTIQSKDEISVDQLKRENELFRTKLIQSQEMIRQYRKALAKQMNIQEKTYDSVSEFAMGLNEEIEEHLNRNERFNQFVMEHEEELDKLDEELDKMKQNTEEFRWNSSFIDSE